MIYEQFKYPVLLLLHVHITTNRRMSVRFDAEGVEQIMDINQKICTY